uniref:Uncharacterized protein n=1 Tax=Anguilla anguilla TaxID=7936 RepID=A0A0E9VB47_ANGAN
MRQLLCCRLNTRELKCIYQIAM